MYNYRRFEGTPRSDNLERTRRTLNQERTPAYGDALALCRQLEKELNEALNNYEELAERT